MFEVSIIAYPWDLVDSEAAATIAQWHGEIGLGGVSVWIGARGTTQLRARPVEPKVYRTRGGLLFQPEARFFANTRCQPMLSSRLPVRYSLQSIASACAERSMPLRGILSAARIGRMADRYPEFACTNTFAIESKRSLCLGNEDVQEYLCGLAANVTQRYELTGLVLADMSIGWWDAFERPVESSGPLSTLGQSLLAVCFCDACQRNSDLAGVDVPGAQQAVRGLLQRELESGTPENAALTGLLPEHAALAGHLKAQSNALIRLGQRLREQVRCELIAIRTDVPSGLPGSDAEWISGGKVLTRIAEDRRGEMSSKDRQRFELLFSAADVMQERDTTLVARLHEAAEQGFAGAAIDHYGILPESAMSRLRQGIRFARRSAR